MNEELDFLEDCPCNLCLVKVMCRIVCQTERDWFLSLKMKQKSLYLRSPVFRFPHWVKGIRNSFIK